MDKKILVLYLTAGLVFSFNFPVQVPNVFKESVHQKQDRVTDKNLLNYKTLYAANYSLQNFNEIFKKFENVNKNNLEKDLHLALNLSSLSFYTKHYTVAYNSLKIADNRINRYEERLVAQKVGEEIISLLLNDLVKNYNPLICERVFVNIYKAFIHLKKGKLDEANVELNRALERLEHAKAIFEKENSLLQDQLNKHTQGKVKLSQKTFTELDKYYTNLDLYKPYKDFENPLVYYLKGILYFIDGDFSNAQDMFKIAYGLIKGNEKGAKEVAKVWKWTKAKPRGTYAWIIVFNGLTFKKVEEKIDLPLFLFTDKAYYFGFALPVLKERPLGSNSITVTYEGKIYKPLEVVNIDRIYAWEFKQRLKTLVFKEILRSSIKTITQIALREKLGSIGGIAGGAFQALSTQADTRQWYYLPKKVQVLALKVKKGKKIKLSVGSKKVEIPILGKHNFIFVHVFPGGEVFTENFKI